MQPHTSEANSNARRLALQWVRSGPMAALLISRNLLLPLQRLQRECVFLGSRAFEKTQLAVEAQAINAGKVGMSRTFAISELAEGVLEDRCLAMLHTLQSGPETWLLMLDNALTAEMVGLAHRMISRAGGLVHKELAFLHRRFPYCLFLVVKHPQTAIEIKNRPRCLRDEFSDSFMQRYDIESLRARLMLMLVASLLHIHIAEIECRHASLRRRLQRVQARARDLVDLSAFWVAQRCQTRRRVRESELGRGVAASPSGAGSSEDVADGNAAASSRQSGLGWSEGGSVRGV